MSSSGSGHLNVVHSPSAPEPIPLSPALREALRMYNELKNHCDFSLGTSSHVWPEQALEDGDFRVSHYAGPAGGGEYRTVSTDLLLSKYADQLTPDQQQALEIGMPKIYWAFEQVGFPDLSIRESTGVKSFTSFGTIYFDEFAIAGRNFGSRISLLNDSKETILEALQKALDNSFFDKTAKARRAEMRGFVHLVGERVETGRQAEQVEAAFRIELEREVIRRKMRGLEVDNEISSSQPPLLETVPNRAG